MSEERVKMSEKICGIYKITNNINGKIYIGQSRDVYNRWKEHKGAIKSRACLALYNALNKYGIENFSFEVIEECPFEKMNEREIYYIKEYNSYVGSPNSHGYNMTKGGALCFTHVGNDDQGRVVYRYDINWNFIAKYRNQKKAAIAVGLKSSASIQSAIKRNGLAGGYQWRYYATDKIYPYIRLSRRKHVYQYDLDGNFIREFDGIQTAADEVRCSRSLIELCCEGNCETGKSYMWRYTYSGKIPPAKKIAQPSKWKPVEQYTIDGIFIKIYPCANIASQETGVTLSAIRHVLNGDSKTASGYVFRYKLTRKGDNVAKGS